MTDCRACAQIMSAYADAIAAREWIEAERWLSKYDVHRDEKHRQFMGRAL